MQSLILIFSFFIGLIFGSFLNVLIPRLKEEKRGIVLGRSMCDHCQTLLKWIDLIPVISWLDLHGKCRYCKNKISIRYPLIEFITGATFTLLTYQFWSAEPQPYVLVLFLIYSVILLFTFFYDFLYMEISDWVLGPGIIISLIIPLLIANNNYIPTIKDALIGASIPLGFFLLQILISKGEWIGGGDLRIGAFMGLILGWEKVIVALVLSYLFGSISAIILLLRKKSDLKTAIPFGPFLVLGTFISLFYGNKLIEWYIGLIMMM